MEGVYDTVVGAITSNVWVDFDAARRGNAEELQMLMLEFEDGRLALAKASDNYLVCAYGDSQLEFGTLRIKVERHRSHGSRPGQP
jgi:hypothetical protein